MAFIIATETLTQTHGEVEFSVSPEAEAVARYHDSEVMCHWPEVYTCQQFYTRVLTLLLLRLCQAGAVILGHYSPHEVSEGAPVIPVISKPKLQVCGEGLMGRVLATQVQNAAFIWITRAHVKPDTVASKTVWEVMTEPLETQWASQPDTCSSNQEKSQ